jgi:hypothetical protein
MKKKVVLEIAIFILIIYLIWDSNSTTFENIAMLSPFLFIFGLMYLILRK